MWRVLVVQDYPSLAKVLSIALGRQGAHVVRVGSAQRARAQSGSFDLAILDVELADGSGVSLADELLESRRVGRVVFFTGSQDVELKARAGHLGPVVDKTDGVERLQRVVFGLLQAPETQALAVGDDLAPGAELAELPSGRSGTRPRFKP